MSNVDRNLVNIRRMTRNDVDTVISMDWAEIPDKQMIASQRGGPLDASFLAELEGHLVGFVLARFLYVGRPLYGVCQLNLIAVKPEYQHRGISSLLLNKLQSHCKEQGISTMRALVHQDNAELKDYLQKEGFVPSKVLNFERPCQ
jgi:GNAT superfamily N-acetyltransferase